MQAQDDFRSKYDKPGAFLTRAEEFVGDERGTWEFTASGIMMHFHDGEILHITHTSEAKWQVNYPVAFRNGVGDDNDFYVKYDGMEQGEYNQKYDAYMEAKNA